MECTKKKGVLALIPHYLFGFFYLLIDDPPQKFVGFVLFSEIYLQSKKKFVNFQNNSLIFTFHKKINI